MFSDFSVASFAVRVVTWNDISVIVFFNSTTNVLSTCVAVVRFANSMVWDCCILVNNATLARLDCTLDAYPWVFEGLDDLWVPLNALAK